MPEQTEFNKLKPGPETDKLVAEAIGILHIMVNKLDGSVACSHVESSMGTFDDFAPSTDLNDAFCAAEQIDLFGPGVLHIAHFENHWYLANLNKKLELPRLEVPKTLAMAVCLEILKLKNASAE